MTKNFIDKIKKWNDRHFETTGKRRKHLTVTYGCQMNAVRCILFPEKNGPVKRPIYKQIYGLFRL